MTPTTAEPIASPKPQAASRSVAKPARSKRWVAGLAGPASSARALRRLRLDLTAVVRAKPVAPTVVSTTAPSRPAPGQISVANSAAAAGPSSQQSSKLIASYPYAASRSAPAGTRCGHIVRDATETAGRTTHAARTRAARTTGGRFAAMPAIETAPSPTYVAHSSNRGRVGPYRSTSRPCPTIPAAVPIRLAADTAPATPYEPVRAWTKSRRPTLFMANPNRPTSDQTAIGTAPGVARKTARIEVDMDTPRDRSVHEPHPAPGLRHNAS
jgi:hypothetical protein